MIGNIRFMSIVVSFVFLHVIFIYGVRVELKRVNVEMKMKKKNLIFF